MKTEPSNSNRKRTDRQMPAHSRHFTPSRYSDSSYESSDDELSHYDFETCYPLQEPVLFFLKKLHLHKIGSVNPKEFQNEEIEIPVFEDDTQLYFSDTQPDDTPVYCRESSCPNGENISGYKTVNYYDRPYQSNLPCYDPAATRSNNAFPEHWQPTQSFLEETPEVVPLQTDNQRRVRDSDPPSQHTEAFIGSLFPKVPPCLKFNLHGTKVQLLPRLFRKRLRWKSSNAIPKVVIWALMRSNFQPSDPYYKGQEFEASSDWIYYFGSRLRVDLHQKVLYFQKVNHFPATFYLGRKDQLWRGIAFMQRTQGLEEFSFIPRTFCIPKELELLEKEWLAESEPHYWIIKPPAKARGIGIQVATKWSQISKANDVIVQKYISNPFLINNAKFDLRIYVFLYSVYPLIIYVHKEGLVRFASHQYKTSPFHTDDQFMHLTNYSINRKNTDYRRNSDAEQAFGHKWTLSVLWQYMSNNGIDWMSIWENIKDIVVKTCISAEHNMKEAVKNFCASPYNVQELYGFDIILDENLKPWLLEVNISPSLNIDSDLDFKVKDRVVVDMLNLTGINLPSESDISRSMSELAHDRYPQPSGSSILRKTSKRNLGTYPYDEYSPTRPRRSSADNRKPPAPMHPWHLDCRIIQSKLGPDEVSKQTFYENRSRKRKGRAVRLYKSTYARIQSRPPLSPSTPNLLESNFSEASTSSSQTVSQGTDPESANFDAYLRVVEERKRLAQLKRDVKNSPFDCPWLKNRISDAIERQATSRRRPRKAAAPVRAPQYWPNLVFYRRATQHILDKLTPADVRCLIRLLDSINRAGDFQLVFPAATSQANADYLNYFRSPGYYNLLNYAYLDKYKANSQIGIQLLKELCQKEVHLKSTLYDELDEANIWQPCSTDFQIY